MKPPPYDPRPPHRDIDATAAWFRRQGSSPADATRMALEVRDAALEERIATIKRAAVLLAVAFVGGIVVITVAL